MIFFSKNLEFLRKKEGIKQSDLAQQVGVKANTISNYEKGVSQPDYNILRNILTVFSIDADTLLYKDVYLERASRILDYIPMQEDVSIIDKLLNKIDMKESKVEAQAEQIGVLKHTIQMLEEQILGLPQSDKPKPSPKASAGSSRVRKGGVAGSGSAQYAGREQGAEVK